MRVGLRHRRVLVLAALFGALVGGVARLLGLPAPNALLLGWCVGVLAFGLPTMVFMCAATPEQLRRRAELLDDGEGAVLAASLAAAIASLGATGWAMMTESGPADTFENALVVATIVLSWAFVHLLFAVRYAHEYWQAGGTGLDFPGGETPDFLDVLYFALTIGMTFQTSDVVVTGRLLRRLTLVHALVAFLFNVVILATAVNVTADLLG